MSYTRREFIDGLLDLACFLDAHAQVAVPRFGTEITLHTGTELPDDGTWEGARDAVEAFAAAVGDESPTESPHGHYSASRQFGPVSYRAVAIPAEAMAEYRALSSYDGCVQPGALSEVA